MTDSSAALSSGELPDHVPVDCGTLHGVLFHHRLENGRSPCITAGKSKDLISPCEFERRGGKAATRNWKKSIQYKQQPIGDFLQNCISSTTLLHGELPEEVYMWQPEGFIVSGKEHLFCHLQ